MTPDELQKRIQVKAIMENPLWGDAIKDIKVQFAVEMLEIEDSAKRDELYREYKTLDRVLGRLQAYSNDVAMVKEKRNV